MHQLKNSFFFLLLLAAFPGKTQKLDSIANAAAALYMKDSSRVGLSIGIYYKGKNYTWHYGETKKGSGLLPSNESQYEIGSMTKTFTGLLVANAIRSGKIKLNDDIRKYIPGSYPNLQYPNGDPIKVGYLLAHTSLLPSSFVRTPEGRLADSSFTRQLREIKMDTLKPFVYRYSNIGYQLLGHMLEYIYGTPYEQLLKKYIAGPLKMKNTSTSPAPDKMIPGYTANGTAAPPIDPSYPGAGAIWSTLPDMLKYMQYQLAEKDDAVKLSHRVLYGNIDEGATCFQWTMGKTWNLDYYLRTDGGTAGFRTFYVLYPDYDLAIVLLSNQNNDTAGRKLYDITTSILRSVKTK